MLSQDIDLVKAECLEHRSDHIVTSESLSVLCPELLSGCVVIFFFPFSCIFTSNDILKRANLLPSLGRDASHAPDVNAGD